MIKKFLLSLLLITSIVSIPAMACTGWVKEENPDRFIYLINDNKAPEGLLKIDDERWFYLNSKAERMIGWVQTNEGSVYTTKTGVIIRNKWQLIDNVWYYFDNNGAMAKTPTVINGTTYNFASDGHWIG